LLISKPLGMKYQWAKNNNNRQISQFQLISTSWSGNWQVEMYGRCVWTHYFCCSHRQDFASINL